MNSVSAELQAPRLTDDEREALSYAYFDKQFIIQAYEDMAGKGDVISGWREVTNSVDARRHGALFEAMRSLERFGLVDGYYEGYSRIPTRERIIRTTDDGIMYVPATGWRHRINDKGRYWLKQYNARLHKCCDGCVALNCVCSERTFCAEHGGGCHGTHE